MLKNIDSQYNNTEPTSLVQTDLAGSWR